MANPNDEMQNLASGTIVPGKPPKPKDGQGADTISEQLSEPDKEEEMSFEEEK